ADQGLRVMPIRVTRRPALTRIMRHEFSRPDGADDFEFDPGPAERFIAALSTEQRQFLINYDQERPTDRLVVFITVQPKNGLRMPADFSPGGLAMPYCAFTVFHCNPKTHEATLVCHTNHFLMNLANCPLRREQPDGAGGKK